MTLPIVRTAGADVDLSTLSWGFGPVVEVPAEPVHALVSAAATRWPDAVAVIYQGQSMTYRELELRANALADRLRRLGCRSEERVGVCVRRGPEMVVALLGVLKAGGAYVPIDPSYPADRVATILADAAPLLCITDEFSRGAVASTIPLVFMDDTGTASAAPHAPVSSTSLAYVLFTSGSTGRPKGVCVEHGSLVDFVVNNARAYAVDEHTRMLALASLGFDVAVAEIFTALVSGATLVVAADEDRLSVDRLESLLRADRVDVAELPPSLLGLLDPSALPDLRLVSVGGEAPSAPLVAQWLAAGRQVVNAYGPTETTVTATLHRCRPEDRASVPIGRPMANHRVYVLDPNGRPTPPGAPGELFVAGAGVARGYLDRPDLTHERFLPDPFAAQPGAVMYRTGDRVSWNDDHTLEFLGRVDEQLNVRGFRIEPGEVETRLREHPDVADAAVVARGHGDDARLVAFLVAAPGRRPDPADVTAWCLERLPLYLVPTSVLPVAALPLTPSGKVDRAALREDQPTPRQGDVRPSERATVITPAQKSMLDIWEDVFGSRGIGPDDDFFALGGHSLLAMRLLSRMRRQLGIDISMRDLYSARTVAALVSRTSGAIRKATEAAELAPSPTTAEPPLPHHLPRQRTTHALRSGPVSFAQQRLWFVDQLSPEDPTYNLPVVLTLNGPVDVHALTRALARLPRRHDVLRTEIVTVDGRPQARVHDDVAVPLTLADLATLDARSRKQELRRWVDDDVRSPFVLSEAPLWRARLVKTGPEEFTLVLVLHHAIADGWSISVLLDDLGELYRSETGLPTPAVEPPPVSYLQFAAWQRDRLTEKVADDQLRFWSAALAGAPAALDLPTDRPRTPVRSSGAGRVTQTLPPGIATSFSSLLAREGATLFTGLLAVFQVLLGRLAATDDVVVACPTVGRNEPELERVVGLFMDLVAIRGDLSGDPTFAELLARVRDRAVDAFAHQDVPFERVVEAVGASRDVSRSPVAQVAFNLLSYPDERLDLPGISVEPLQVEPPGSLLDLTLYARRTDAGIDLEVVYDRDLFDDERMRAFLGQFAHLVGCAAADRDARIGAWSLAAASQDVLPDVTRHLEAACGSSVLERFRGHARKAPHRAALRFQHGELDYESLESRSDHVAARLTRSGIGPGQVVAISAVRHPDLVVAMLAVHKTGAAFSLLDATHPTPRLREMLRAAPPDAWLAVDATPLDPVLAAYLRKLPLACRTTVADAAAEGRELTAPRGHATVDDVAHILFTSGSTGSPRAVRSSHRPLTHFLDWYTGQFAITRDDRFALVSGIAHDPVLRDVFTALAVGATIAVPPPEIHRTPRRLLHWLEQEQTTILHLTPQLGRLLSRAASTQREQGAPAELPALRLIATGGDVLRTTDVEALRRLAPNAEVVSFYGATETPQAMAWQRTQEDGPFPRPVVPLGSGIADVQLLVVNSRGEVTGIGETGEIVIRTPHLAMGYVGNRALTAERFTVDPDGTRRYRTGDLGRFLPDGSVEFVARSDDQVKIRGYRVEPAEVSHALERHPHIAQALVVRQDDSGGESRLGAYVVPSADATPSPEELLRYLRSRLPDYAVPSTLVVLAEIPLTSNGKVDVPALPAPGPTTSARPAPTSTRNTPTEELVAQVWARVLNRNVGSDENFFDVGGDSLRLVEVQAQLETELGHRLSVVDLFQFPTIRLLAAHLGAGESTSAPTTRRIEARRNLRQRRRTHQPHPSGRSERP